MTPHLVGLDIDGTTITHEGALSDVVRQAVRDVAAAGHHVTIATGRAIVGTLPILDRLGITTGYAVCSNGAITLRLDPELERGYEVIESVTFDPAPVLTLLREHAPTALVAVEDPGVGFKVSANFPDGELDASERVVPWDELLAHPVTRVTLREPEASPDEFLDLVHRVGLLGVARHQPRGGLQGLRPGAAASAAAGRADAYHRHRRPAQRRRDAPVGRSWCGHGQRAGRGEGGRRRGHRPRRRRRPRPRPTLTPMTWTTR
jgi:hypothetical protein